MIEFKYPIVLFALILIPLILFWYYYRGQFKEGVMRYSDLNLIPYELIKRGILKVKILISIKILIILLIIIALARPRLTDMITETITDIVDIMLVIDMSSSMLAEDFKPNRLEAVKEVAKLFIKEREGDRLGIIIFAGESFIQCPLTTDIEVLIEFIDKIKIADKEFDGTAIGMAIANAVNRLRFTESKSKLMILLSDGSNNRGELDPITAAELASKFDIKIYTIGAGKRGKAPYPVQNVFGRTSLQMIEVEVDEKTLKEIADVTKGDFYRATDNKSLQKIYEDINQLERTELEIMEYKKYKDLYSWFVIPAALLSMSLIILSNLLFRKQV